MSNTNTTVQTNAQQTYYCTSCKVHYTIKDAYKSNGTISHKGWCMDRVDWNKMNSNNGWK